MKRFTSIPCFTSTPWLAALSLILVTQLGSSCEQSPPAATPGTSLRLELENVYLAGSIYLLQVAVCADTDAPFQAFHIDLDWVGDTTIVFPVRHISFDDDGALFSESNPDGEATAPIDLVDVRHGTPAPPPGACLARLWILAAAGGQTSLSASGVLGKPDGTLAQTGVAILDYTP